MDFKRLPQVLIVSLTFPFKNWVLSYILLSKATAAVTHIVKHVHFDRFSNGRSESGISEGCKRKGATCSPVMHTPFVYGVFKSNGTLDFMFRHISVFRITAIRTSNTR